MPKYPQVKVELVDQDGNAFAILGRCISAAKKAGLTPEQIEEFRSEATSGSYNHLLATCMKFFDCDSGELDEEEPLDEDLDDEDWEDDEDWDNEEDDAFYDEDDDEDDDYWDFKEDFEDEDDDEDE